MRGGRSGAAIAHDEDLPAFQARALKDLDDLCNQMFWQLIEGVLER